MPPISVNFTALERKFATIWRSRTGSPTSAGAIAGSISALSSRPFVDAVCTKLLTAASSSFDRSIVHGSICSLPASIFEKSRTSPMIVISDCAELCEVSTMLRWCSSRFVRDRTSSMPMTPIIGVRISWLIDARNVDFARLACSASSRASAACACASSRRAMSCPIADAIALKSVASCSSSDAPRISARRAVVAPGDVARRGDELAQRAHRQPPEQEAGGRAGDDDQREDRDLRDQQLARCATPARRPARRAGVDEAGEGLDRLHDAALLEQVGGARRGARTAAARRRRSARRRRRRYAAARAA